MDVQTLLPGPGLHRAAPQVPPGPVGRRIVGAFYLVMGGVHLGVVSADADTYRHFADDGLFSFVREGWWSIVMAHPSFWGLLLMAGEITLGALLLAGPRAARLGWAGVIAFHLLLLVFGFWLWVYAVPALVILVWLARRDLVRSVR
jgi:hypothetical protein